MGAFAAGVWQNGQTAGREQQGKRGGQGDCSFQKLVAKGSKLVNHKMQDERVLFCFKRLRLQHFLCVRTEPVEKGPKTRETGEQVVCGQEESGIYRTRNSLSAGIQRK